MNIITAGTRKITIPNFGPVVPARPGGADNWWEAGGATGCIQALQPVGAASYAASLTDLSGSGNDAAEGVMPTWNATDGWVFSGSEWLDTGLLVLGTYSIIIQYTGATVAGRTLCGAMGVGSGERFVIQPFDGGGNRVVYSNSLNGNNTFVAPGLAAGNLAIAGQGCYRNGTSEGAVDGDGDTDRSVLIGAIATTASPAIGVANVQSFAIYDNALSAGEVAAVVAAMAALP